MSAVILAAGSTVLAGTATASSSSLEGLVTRLASWIDAGRLDEAAAVCDSALAQRNFDRIAPSELAGAARLLQTRGFLHYLDEEFEGALPWYERARAVIARGGRADDHVLGSLAAEITSDHAEILRLTGRTRAAETALLEAVELARTHVPRTRQHAITLNNLAGVYKDTGDLTRAEALLEEALRITQSQDEGPDERLATAHLNLAEVYRLQDRLDFAEPHYRRALEIARRTYASDDPELVYFLAQMAVQCSRHGERAEALSLRDEALSILARAPRSTRFLEAELLRAVGEDLIAIGQPRAAIDRLRESVRLQEELFGSDHWITAESRVELARALKQSDAAGRRDAAVELDRAIAAAEPAAPAILVEALGLRASLRRDAGDDDGARTDLRAALDGIDRLRTVRGGGERSRAMVIGTHVDLFHDLIELQLAEGDPAAAFATAERMRARTLLDELERSSADPRDDLPRAVRDSLETIEREVSARLAQHQDALLGLPYAATGDDAPTSLREHQLALDRALLELRDVQEEIRQRSPRWRSILASARVDVDSHEVASLVGERGLLLEYAIGARGSLLFAITGDGSPIRVFDLEVPRGRGNARDLAGPLTRDTTERLVREGRRLLQCVRGECTQERDEFLRFAADALVPRALRAALRRADRVVVVPDGALGQFPFEALRVEGARGGPPRSWLEDFGPTSYAGSATTLMQLLARDAGREPTRAPEIDVLSISDPSFTRGDEPTRPAAGAAPTSSIGLSIVRDGRALALPPLPGTRVESAAIVDAFGGSKVVVLQDSAATEHALREWAPRARLLHLATHGFAEWNGSASLASLVLHAPSPIVDSRDDGLLQSFEIGELGLHADLAVLSACETALGEHIEGEGVFALSRNFLAAGAARVIATLWSVNDRASARLVSDLFAAMRPTESTPGPHGVARALRRAKLAVALDPRTAAPFYWAPFVLSGID